jgi:hypothetical protein
MKDQNHEHEHVQDSQNDELDRALDAALAQYASAEARAGLEDRVLANLRAERPNVGEHAWWRWGWAGPLLAIVTVAITLAWRADRNVHLPLANHASTTEQIRRPTNPPAAASERRAANTPTRTSHNGGAIAGLKATHRAQAVAQADPKLDVFPSPHPLSEEELALAQYVRNFPTDAKLVAQAQQASAKEVLAKMQALAKESTESN